MDELASSGTTILHFGTQWNKRRPVLADQYWKKDWLNHSRGNISYVCNTDSVRTLGQPAADPLHVGLGRVLVRQLAPVRARELGQGLPLLPDCLQLRWLTGA